MGGESNRTDYLPTQHYIDNAVWTENHPTTHPAAYQQRLPSITVPFESDFDKFAAHVAYAIRHYVIYRSDGGVFARGLVREKLQPIHWFLLRKSHMQDGQKVRLEAILWRRKDPVRTRNWSLAVEFAMAATTVDAEEEVVRLPQDVINKNDRDLAESVQHDAALVAQKIDRQNHNQGDRIHKMVDIAARLGYPKFLDLWYYGPAHVKAYLNIQTSNRARQLMTARTGGKFPFDGWPMQGEGQSWDTHEWRTFPFRSMLKLCRKSLNDPDLCQAYINNVLLVTDRDLMAAIHEANLAYQISQATDARAFGPLWSGFYNHLVETQEQATHLLSAYRQKSRANGALGFLTGAP